MNSEKTHPPRIDTRKWSCQNIPFPLNSFSKNLLFLSEYSFNYSVKLLFFLWFLCENIRLPLLIVSDPTCPLSRQWPCQDTSLLRQVWRKTDWSAGMLHKLENRHHFEQKYETRSNCRVPALSGGCKKSQKTQVGPLTSREEAQWQVVGILSRQ